MVRVQLAWLVLACSSLVGGCAPRDAWIAAPTVEVVTVHHAFGPQLDETEPAAHVEERATGDLVDVEWRGSWWPAVLVERRRPGWYVHYEGYSKDWDEVASLDRIRDRGARLEEPTIEPMDEDVDP